MCIVYNLHAHVYFDPYSGQFEYELVLKTDLYTQRHTQWYYFQVRRALPGVTYRFKIVNLLKKTSLYNHGTCVQDRSIRRIGFATTHCCLLV